MTTSPSTANITYGPGVLYWAPLGTTEPTGLTGAWPGGWVPLGYCVDEETEILTGRGWMRHDEVVDGDECLTISKETGLSEWQTIDSMNRFAPGPRPMVRMVGASHDSLTTPNHRWLVDRQFTPSLRSRMAMAKPYATRQVGEEGRQFVTTETLGQYDRVPCAAPCISLPQEAKYTDAFVEIVGWWITEGCANGKQIDIYQSEKVNADKCASIRRALITLFGVAVNRHRIGAIPGWRESLHANREGAACFHLNKTAADPFHEVAPDKVVSMDFIRALTQSQLRLLLDTAIAGDGWHGNMISQAREDRLAPLQIAAALLGVRANIHPQGDGRTWVMRLMDRSSFRPVRASKRGHEFSTEVVTHMGMIWCPVTPNSTWLARRNGNVYFTGNTKDGNQSTYALTVANAEVAELLDPVKRVTTGRDIKVSFSLAEITAAHLKVVLNGGTITPTNNAFADAVTTSGSPTVTSATAAFTAADVGLAITGTGIPSLSYIGVVNSPTSIGLSSSATVNTPVNATASGTVTATIAARFSEYTPPQIGGEVRSMLGWDSNDAAERVIWRQVLQQGSSDTQRRKGVDYATFAAEFGIEAPATGQPPFAWRFAANRVAA